MATILFVDDEAAARQNYNAILTHYGHEVLLASSVREAVSYLRNGKAIDLLLTDMRMGAESGLDMLREAHRISPDLEVIVLTGHAEVANAIEAMKLGATDYLTKETDYKEILITIEKALEKHGLKREIERLRGELRGSLEARRIVGRSSAIQAVLDVIRRVAPTESRVLISGESGTGKELVAETIHANSSRRNGPFVAINCGAIPEHVQESELFGYVKGAFTGAEKDKKGLLEAANNGTVFLDEIGEMSLETQVKLLRFLENGEVQPVGSSKAYKIDVRVLAATNRDLAAQVSERRFRDDLYYRLKVVSIHLPALRERKEDIAILATELIQDLNPKTHRHVRGITSQALEALKLYAWPGNIRELRNVIERAMIFTDSDSIDLEHLPEEIFSTPASTPLEEKHDLLSPSTLSLDQIEKNYILEVLMRNGGNKLLTAKQLNIATTTLYRKLRVYGIE